MTSTKDRAAYWRLQYDRTRGVKALAFRLKITPQDAHRMIDSVLKEWYIENGLTTPKQRKVIADHSHLPSRNMMYCSEVKQRFGQEPRPCPFCSGRNIALWLGPNPHMTCAQCGAAGPAVSSGNYEEKHDRAFMLWNCRE